jgi:hypothetical protein
MAAPSSARVRHRGDHLSPRPSRARTDGPSASSRPPCVCPLRCSHHRSQSPGSGFAASGDLGRRLAALQEPCVTEAPGSKQPLEFEPILCWAEENSMRRSEFTEGLPGQRAGRPRDVPAQRLRNGSRAHSRLTSVLRRVVLPRVTLRTEHSSFQYHARCPVLESATAIGPAVVAFDDDDLIRLGQVAECVQLEKGRFNPTFLRELNLHRRAVLANQSPLSPYHARPLVPMRCTHAAARDEPWPTVSNCARSLPEASVGSRRDYR